jgi:spoIIIJ-associated protein
MEPNPAAARPAKSSEQPLEDRLAKIESLARQMVESGGFDLTVTLSRNQPSEAAGTDFESPEFILEFSGPDANLLLERNGELLNAIEYVVLKAVRLDEDHFGKITFDCEDWRRLRLEELRLMAQVAAERVIETGDAFPLGPMSPRERRIIHLALRDQPRVRTLSEGTGAERKVVIMPASGPKS